MRGTPVLENAPEIVRRYYELDGEGDDEGAIARPAPASPVRSFERLGRDLCM